METEGVEWGGVAGFIPGDAASLSGPACGARTLRQKPMCLPGWVTNIELAVTTAAPGSRARCSLGRSETRCHHDR
jgi:hypothetical protein